MAKDIIRYDLLVQGAMRGVMRQVLADVAESGYLPGDHHFTISFHTDAPGVKISRRLQEQWPRELTIILQHQYSDLGVDEEGFAVTLSFRGVREELYIPFASVTGFFDPSVEFGLRFESGEPALEEVEEEETPPALEPIKAAPAKREPAKSEKKAEPKPVETREGIESDAKIVSIDAFRKKT